MLSNQRNDSNQRTMKRIYEDLEKIKKFLKGLDYTVGPYTVEEDKPFIRLKIEIIKRIEDGTETPSSSG